MRGQLDTAIGMILTLVIVAAVLALAVWGFFAITRMTSEAAYERVYDSLESAGASHASFGSQRYERIPSPEPFCIFNASVHVDDRECTPGYSGHEICESADLRSYWGNMSEDDGNIVFRSGRSAQIDYIAPHNGAFACFRQGSQVVFFEGRGRYATVSPMREIGSLVLHTTDHSTPDHCDGGPTDARLGVYTHSERGTTPDLLIFERNGVTELAFCSPQRFEMQLPTGPVVLHDDATSYLQVTAASVPNQLLVFTAHTFTADEIIVRP